MFSESEPRRERPDIYASALAACYNRSFEPVFVEQNSHGWNDPNIKLGYSQESIESGLRLKNILGNEFDLNFDPEEVVLLPFTPKVNEAYVDRLNEYHWLLRYSAEICIGNSLSPELRRKLLKRDLSHEFEHALKGKGEDGLLILYGVKFNQDPTTNSVSWQPRITLTGQARRKVIRAMITGTTWTSSGDNAALGRE